MNAFATTTILHTAVPLSVCTVCRNPLWGTKLLGFSLGRGLRALKEPRGSETVSSKTSCTVNHLCTALRRDLEFFWPLSLFVAFPVGVERHGAAAPAMPPLAAVATDNVPFSDSVYTTGCYCYYYYYLRLGSVVAVLDMCHLRRVPRVEYCNTSSSSSRINSSIPKGKRGA